MKIGQIVISKAGRDRGLVFVVVACEGEYVFLADGRTRRLENPKRKKNKHLQPTNFVSGAKWEKDADIRNIIKLSPIKDGDGGGNSHG